MQCVNLCEMKKSFYFPLKKNYVLPKIRRYKDSASHLKISTNCVNVSYIKWFYVCMCAHRAVGCSENGWLWRMHWTV